MTTNEDRAELGLRAVETDPDYAQNELDTSMSDVVADLMHLADREGIDFAVVLERATRHHAEEVSGE